MSFTELTRTSSHPPRPGGHLHIDATMGCAGDMLVGALVDLGLSLVVVRTALTEVGVVDVGPLVRERSQGRARGLHLSFVDASGLPVDQREEPHASLPRTLPPKKGRSRAPAPRREGRSKAAVTVARALDLDDAGRIIGDEGVISGAAKQGPRRALADWLTGRPVSGRELFALVENGRLAPPTRARTLKALRRLLDARAQATGVEMLEATVDGRAAVDLVCDLVSVSALVEALAPARITASPIALSATPLVNDGALAPGPSTWVLHALAGLRTVERDLPWECTTPTGAALLWTLAGAGERRPPLAFHHIGTGLGTREAPGVVNATRALYAERRATVDDGAVMRIEAVLDAAVDRARLVRELEVKGAHDITFARVEDAQGMPLFRIDALVDTHGGDDEVRAVMKTLDDAGRAVASFAGRRLTSPVRIVTVPVGKGAKQTPVRMRIKGHEENAAPVDEDVRRGARRLRVDEDRVRALATEAFLRLAGERESSAPVDEHGGGEDE